MGKPGFHYVLAVLLGFTTLTGTAGTPADKIVRLATTTSTENSGLLTYLLPRFEQASAYKVHVIAAGTGKALRMGRDGDVDVVLTHAPAAEQGFVSSGHGVQHHAVMYNDFILVGPEDDPAKLKQSTTTAEAFKRLASAQINFISRGDDSGTHKKELALWQELPSKRDTKWYREVGQGMGKTLQIASEMNAYCLTDRGTWLAYRESSPLIIVHEGGEDLHNPYSIIAVNPEKHPHINHQGASALIHWITSDTGQKLIASYRLYGKQLFIPSGGSLYAGLKITNQ